MRAVGWRAVVTAQSLGWGGWALSSTALAGAALGLWQ